MSSHKSSFGKINESCISLGNKTRSFESLKLNVVTLEAYTSECIQVSTVWSAQENTWTGVNPVFQRPADPRDKVPKLTYQS